MTTKCPSSPPVYLNMCTSSEASLSIFFLINISTAPAIFVDKDRSSDCSMKQLVFDERNLLSNDKTSVVISQGRYSQPY